MKKTLLKILETILVVVVFFVIQYYVRQYYNIDPRIWFFVVLGMFLIGIIAILVAFYSEIKSMEEYFKIHSFSKFLSKKLTRISKKVKQITEKIVNSFIFNLLSFITSVISFTGIMYKLFFYDDFISRKTLYIIFLVMIAWTAISRIIKAAVIEEEKCAEELVYGGMWSFIFLTNFFEFIYI